MKVFNDRVAQSGVKSGLIKIVIKYNKHQNKQEILRSGDLQFKPQLTQI
jgi:hypothetical protein